MRNRVILAIILLIVLIILIITGDVSSFDNIVYNFIISFKNDRFTRIMKIITKTH